MIHFASQPTLRLCPGSLVDTLKSFSKINNCLLSNSKPRLRSIFPSLLKSLHVNSGVFTFGYVRMKIELNKTPLVWLNYDSSSPFMAAPSISEGQLSVECQTGAMFAGQNFQKERKIYIFSF